MLSLVTAAEQQYRHDTWARDRERAILDSIRDRRAAEKAALAETTRRPRRTAWARPIGVRLAPAEVCTTACATA
ncbi:hypothetical protein [Microbacterium sp.]|jgi:hypothetical protein|uniref:hypothetical protein n=1 Tax=Microbacterium sp. TaxID=51671 RepID=UPI0035B22608